MTTNKVTKTSRKKRDGPSLSLKYRRSVPCRLWCNIQQKQTWRNTFTHLNGLTGTLLHCTALHTTENPPAARVGSVKTEWQSSKSMFKKKQQLPADFSFSRDVLISTPLQRRLDLPSYIIGTQRFFASFFFFSVSSPSQRHCDAPRRVNEFPAGAREHFFAVIAQRAHSSSWKWLISARLPTCSQLRPTLLGHVVKTYWITHEYKALETPSTAPL